MNHTDTIAATATAMGSAGIGIIRISGPEAFAVLEKVFRPKNEKKVMSEQPGYTVHYGMAEDLTAIQRKTQWRSTVMVDGWSCRRFWRPF